MTTLTTTPETAISDCRGADQFQPGHRDGYGDHLASALDRARKGWALNAAEASALVAEVERLRAKVETARKIAKDYWESADEVAETVASDILEALDAE